MTIDLNLRESARAKTKVIAKRILKTYGSPSAFLCEAVNAELVLAEILCADRVVP